MILIFFEKVENTKAEMDAKVNSKTCLEKAFSHILSPFMRVRLQNFVKVQNRVTKICLKKSIGVSKNAEFYAEFKSVGKVAKKFTQKSYGQNTKKNRTFSTFTTGHQSFWLITFFGWTFFKLSQRI